MAKVGHLLPGPGPKGAGRGRGKKTGSPPEPVFPKETAANFGKVAAHEARIDEYIQKGAEANAEVPPNKPDVVQISEER